MSVEPLTASERTRFAEWCEQNAHDSELLARQAEKLGPFAVALVKLKRREAAELTGVALMLRTTVLGEEQE